MASLIRTAAPAGGVLAAVVVVALAGCAPVSGDDGSSDGGAGAAPVAGNAIVPSTPDAPAEVVVEDPVPLQAPEELTEKLTGKKVPRMGKVVVDEDGWVLYRFDGDSADPPASNCDDDCERVWPPAYTDGNPVVKNVDDKLVGSVTRADGTRQLTIDGWPVYRYIGDKKPGQWRGQGVAGTWFVISPNGRKNLSCLPEGTPEAVPPPADDAPAGDAAAGDAPAGGGYGY